MNFVDMHVAMEAIGFQSPDVANKLVAYVEEIMQERTGKEADACKARKDMIKYLKDLTGMKLDIIFDTDMAPCTLPFHINPDSILGYKSIKDFYVEESAATLKRLKEIKSRSFIDLDKGKVGGIFSEYETPIYLGYYPLRSLRLTAREIVAILAHEVGHCLVAYELAFRVVRTNQILTAASKAAAGGDKGQYEYVLKTAEDVLDLKSGVFDEIKETTDQKTVMTVILGKAERKTHDESLMGNTTYDITTFEALADNYAARLGLGKELVTGLEKLYREFGAAEFSTGARIAATMMDVYSIVSMIGAVFLMASNPVVSALYLGLNVLGLYARLDGRDHNNVYDKLSVRFKRVKEQIIQYTKDRNLPSAEVKRCLESVAHIEKTIAQISEYKGFLPAIFNLIDPASRAVNSARDIQKNLESMVANDMYLKAAALRTM
jgi:hypothetical protein